MNGLVEFLRTFGIARLAAIVGVTAGVGIALIIIMVRLGEPQFGVLYADLDYRDAQLITTQLDQDGVSYRMRESGSRIALLVPRNEISSLKVSLANEGVISANGVGYEIFDAQQSLGTTSFQQSINRLRALEGELARTVSSIAGVRSARVHLVLPERSLFTRENAEATASIMVEAQQRLNNGTVRAIVNLVATAVPELSPEHITILDADGNLLATARNGESDSMAEDAMAERMSVAEMRLQEMVTSLVGSIVGPENVRTRLTADFDFSRFTETAEIVDPDSQVVLSSTLIEEESDDRNPLGGRGVSVANGLPGSESDAGNGSATSSNRRTEEITNYEITKTVRNAIRDEGLIVNRLSVAVAINANDANGNVIERSPEELERIEALVKSAIGFQSSRGDQVEIANIGFMPTPPLELSAGAPVSAPTLSSAFMVRLAEIGALLLIGAGLIFFVLRPMFSPSSNNSATSLAKYAGPVSDGNLQHASHGNAPLEEGATKGLVEQHVKIAQIDGQVKESSVNQIQEIVKSHTDESALILKRWIREAL